MPASGPSLGSLTKGSGRSMNKDYSINLSVQQVLSLWVQGTVPTLQHFTEMWYWVFLWCLFSSLLLHGAVGLLMLVALQRHRRGRLITLLLVSVGFLASLSGAVITSQSFLPRAAPHVCLPACFVLSWSLGLRCLGFCTLHLVWHELKVKHLSLCTAADLETFLSQIQVQLPMIPSLALVHLSVKFCVAIQSPVFLFLCLNDKETCLSVSLYSQLPVCLFLQLSGQ
uniref:Transmembrane protein 170B n=1 Tax=Paramormyrops kingsleyae TaxID=1676925 RepID=A0A3B3RHN9_9TELE